MKATATTELHRDPLDFTRAMRRDSHGHHYCIFCAKYHGQRRCRAERESFAHEDAPHEAVSIPVRHLLAGISGEMLRAADNDAERANTTLIDQQQRHAIDGPDERGVPTYFRAGSVWEDRAVLLGMRRKLVAVRTWGALVYFRHLGSGHAFPMRRTRAKGRLRFMGWEK